MSETQLDRFERKFDLFVEEVFTRFERLEARMDRIEARMDRIEARVGVLEQHALSLESMMREKFESVERRLSILENASIAMRTTLTTVQKDILELRTHLDVSPVRRGMCSFSEAHPRHTSCRPLHASLSFVRFIK